LTQFISEILTNYCDKRLVAHLHLLLHTYIYFVIKMILRPWEEELDENEDQSYDIDENDSNTPLVVYTTHPLSPSDWRESVDSNSNSSHEWWMMDFDIAAFGESPTIEGAGPRLISILLLLFRLIGVDSINTPDTESCGVEEVDDMMMLRHDRMDAVCVSTAFIWFLGAYFQFSLGSDYGGTLMKSSCTFFFFSSIYVIWMDSKEHLLSME